MATITANTAPRSGRSIWERLGDAFSAYMTAVARTEQIDRLNALSDEALAARGLRREDIVRYVFRDRICY